MQDSPHKWIQLCSSCRKPFKTFRQLFCSTLCSFNYAKSTAVSGFCRLLPGFCTCLHNLTVRLLKWQCCLWTRHVYNIKIWEINMNFELFLSPLVWTFLRTIPFAVNVSASENTSFPKWVRNAPIQIRTYGFMIVQNVLITASVEKGHPDFPNMVQIFFVKVKGRVLLLRTFNRTT